MRTNADVVTCSGLRWSMGFGMIPKRPALVEYVGRLQTRHAFRRTMEKDARLRVGAVLLRRHVLGRAFRDDLAAA